MKGNVDQIELWLQVSTGMELDDDGEIRPLDPETWQLRRELLEEQGGPPETGRGV
jgi:hypothetical protein